VFLLLLLSQCVLTTAPSPPCPPAACLPACPPQRLGFMDRMKPQFARDDRKMRIYDEGKYRGW
jgi:hypothetical protein